MQDARWLFFDLGNPLISEERAWERRIQRLVSSLERYGRRRAIEEVRAALREASEEFAPRLITRAIEKLIDDLECRKLILAEARYDKELESPYEDAEQTLRTLSSRDNIGVIANQPAGTGHRGTVGEVGANAFHLDLPLLHGSRYRKTGPGNFSACSFSVGLRAGTGSDDWRPA